MKLDTSPSRISCLVSTLSELAQKCIEYVESGLTWQNDSAVKIHQTKVFQKIYRNPYDVIQKQKPITLLIQKSCLYKNQKQG